MKPGAANADNSADLKVRHYNGSEAAGGFLYRLLGGELAEIIS